MQKQLAQVKNIIKSKKGMTTIYPMIIVSISVVIFLFVFEVVRKQVILSGINDNVRETITTCATSNMYESFGAIRDSKVGAYISDGTIYHDVVDISGFYNQFATYYDLQADGKSFIKNKNGNMYLQIRDIYIQVDNSSGTYLIKYKVDISSQFWKKEIYTYNIKQKVRYMKRF